MKNPYFGGVGVSGFHVLVGFAVTSTFGLLTKVISPIHGSTRTIWPKKTAPSN
ncbi:MAG: hypothetical protein RIR66_562 [Actinomycetota bacterium]